jgi:hypothetical protein
MARIRSLGSAFVVIVAAAASIATSPKRASWAVKAPAAEGAAVVLTETESEAERGAKVQVTSAVVDTKVVGGIVQLTGSVGWIDPPADPRPARLAIELGFVGAPESTAARREIEIGRKAAQQFELSERLRFDQCVKGVGCTMKYEIRFAWIEPRGGELKIAWKLDGTVGAQAFETIEQPEGARITVMPMEPMLAVPATESSEPDPFPASTPVDPEPPPP